MTATSVLDVLCLEDLSLVAARLELLEAAEALPANELEILRRELEAQVANQSRRTERSPNRHRHRQCNSRE